MEEQRAVSRQLRGALAQREAELAQRAQQVGASRRCWARTCALVLAPCFSAAWGWPVF